MRLLKLLSFAALTGIAAAQTVTYFIVNNSDQTGTFTYILGDGTEGSFTLAPGEQLTADIPADCSFVISDTLGMSFEDLNASTNPDAGDCSQVDGCDYVINSNSC